MPCYSLPCVAYTSASALSPVAHYLLASHSVPCCTVRPYGQSHLVRGRKEEKLVRCRWRSESVGVSVSHSAHSSCLASFLPFGGCLLAYGCIHACVRYCGEASLVFRLRAAGCCCCCCRSGCLYRVSKGEIGRLLLHGVCVCVCM